MADTESTATAVASTTTSLLDQIVEQGHMARQEVQVPYARALIGEFITSVVGAGEPSAAPVNVVAAIEDHVALIDELIAKQLNAILHHPALQTLEASWRGLHYLVMKT